MIDDSKSYMQLHLQLYELTENAFGKYANSYNGHNFLHMPESVKHNGPMWLFSAERFEDYYGLTKHYYCPGTENTPKQIMQNCMFQAVTKHRCSFQKTLQISANSTKKRDDTLLWAFGSVFKVLECLEKKEDSRSKMSAIERKGGNAFRCCEMSFSKITTAVKLGLDLPWSSVGIFKAGERKNDSECVIKRSEVKGKVVWVKKFFIVCPKEWINN